MDIQTYLADDLLVKMDIATMAHSLEARSPLLDPAVMDLAASLPLEMKLDDGTTKRIFKQAMSEWLPDEILHREKMGFRIPFGDWLRNGAGTCPATCCSTPAASTGECSASSASGRSSPSISMAAMTTAIGSGRC